ncbi:FAD-linked sulfhydryl oxidase ALR [Apiospora phragmitis]|uniref:Sulfhydryl oxidase n=1 Tax=Apiospora phragmitis TaxID=2905665 RepID=A0ABR1VDD5_9PEZI
MAVDGTETTGANSSAGESIDPKKLPPGVVLGKDGKPCRACSSKMAFSAFVSQQTKPHQKSSSGAIPGMMAGMMAGSVGAGPASSGTASTSSFHTPAAVPSRSDCPPDVEELGRSTWTLLHSIAATYPSAPSTSEQRDLRSFMGAFARLYPCWSCAEDFQHYMARQQMPVGSRDEFGKWLCEAHNAVNRKLGKQAFDCVRWEERWRDGWKDGRCD